MNERDRTLSPEDRLLLTASPHLKSPDSTPRIMWNVVGSLLPIVAVAIYFFGPSALLVMTSATVGAMGVEWAFGKKRTLWDGSAAITGILLGLCLPAGFPLWMAFLGGGFGVGFGKLVFGGLGQNPFNPALVGRAFLQAAFPTAIGCGDGRHPPGPLEVRGTGDGSLQPHDGEHRRLPWGDGGNPHPDLRWVSGPPEVPELADSRRDLPHRLRLQRDPLPHRR